MTLDDALAAMPIVAILRGVEPTEAVTIGEAVAAAGIPIIEVPLNSPDPFTSIAMLVRALKGKALVGRRAATPTTAEPVQSHNRAKDVPLPEGRADHLLETLGKRRAYGRSAAE